MRRLVLALGVALGVLAFSGTASAQFYRTSSWRGGHYHAGGIGHYHYHPGGFVQHFDHFHYIPGHYHYHAPRVYSTPFIQPYGFGDYRGIGYPGIGFGSPRYIGGSAFNFGYARPGLSFGLSFIR